MSKAYLSFTKRERTGVLTLAAILLIVSVLPHLIRKPDRAPDPVLPAMLLETKARNDLADHPHPDSLHIGREERGDYERPESYGDRRKGYSSRFQKQSYARYPPYRYKSGGSYYPKRYDASKAPYGGFQTPVFNQQQRYSTERPRYTPVPVDINTADTTAFIALPGIGSKLAARIVSFRNKLGGFESVEKIREVYGLRDSVFMMLVPYLRCDSAYVRRPLLTYGR